MGCAHSKVREDQRSLFPSVDSLHFKSSTVEYQFCPDPAAPRMCSTEHSQGSFTGNVIDSGEFVTVTAFEEHKLRKWKKFDGTLEFIVPTGDHLRISFTLPKNNSENERVIYDVIDSSGKNQFVFPVGLAADASNPLILRFFPSVGHVGGGTSSIIVRAITFTP